MPNTYTQIYLHTIFAVYSRVGLLVPEHREELFKYITGIVQNRKHKMIAINGVADHLHMLIGMRPDVALSDLMRDVKSASSGFINEQHWVRGKFRWQEGFGGFSHSRSELDGVIRYIQEQESHHARHTFREEYVRMLKEFDIPYDERYVFHDLVDDDGLPPEKVRS